MAVDRGILKVGGVLVTGLLSFSIYAHYRNKQRDELTSDFLSELRKELNPAAQGLPGLDALDESYLNKVKKNLSAAGTAVTVLVMKNADAVRMAERIKNAWGTFNDDEEAVYQVFRELKDKVQVSQLAGVYHQVYGVSLIEELKNKLDDSEIKIVVDIIKVKAAYRKA